LHQAIEAKEGVKINAETRTYATVTFQNLFRMYKRLAGMTGTALSSEEEFYTVYGLDVVVVPTNKPSARKDHDDLIFQTSVGKYRAVARAVKERHDKGQPVLVGTVSIEDNEAVSAYLSEAQVPHEVLNAKNHEREGEIIAEAGKEGRVTVATNLAGRGVDIKLGGALATPEMRASVLEKGGLMVVGTERHDARRIDNQLRGRAGRQGDPGASQFYVSLEDELMRRFGGDRVKNIMDRFGLPEDQPIENKIISKSIESAQAKIEGFNFDIRKHVLEYDDVMNKQREVIYKKRKEILTKETLKSEIIGMVEEEIEQIVGLHTAGHAEDWNVGEIKDALGQIFRVDEDSFKRLLELKRSKDHMNDVQKVSAIIEFLKGLAKEAYGKKEQEIKPEIMRQIEKAMYLRAIDTFWMNHLDDVDYLREGIGLRGYGQRDPLVEYKKEAYLLFQNLMAAIRIAVITNIFKVGLLKEEPAPQKNILEEAKYQGAEEQPAQFASDSTLELSSRVSGQTIRNKTEIGRNDPCPCGSGKKYKKCCGA
ncbi:MAG TPA: preprotein translocase subunit SecA, partial [Candidatus Moranbacteria bacterium]|nr:preprotein translocase subunit SecA [Candidatus Moranbacteria bacterium]